MFDDILCHAREYLDDNEDLELVEIVKSVGATPRSTGAFMFVDINGETFGTVGGGEVEHQATLYAIELLKNKTDGIKEYDLSQKKAENIGMVCGGNNTIKFTYLSNNEKSKKIIKDLEDKNKTKSTVYIFGGGHVSREVGKLLKYVGFEYVVWDDRIDFANEERFPDAKKIICKPFENIISLIDIKETDFIIIMTRGHAYDYVVEEQILRSKAFYIGCIGSKMKNKVIKENLIANGFTEEETNKVHAPIGFRIAADTPEEIAVSIVSEAILFRAKLEGRRKILDGTSLLNCYV